MAKLTERQITAIEEKGWNVKEYLDGYELESWSNAGEDILLWLPKHEDLIDYLYHYWQDFDPDEHASSWYGKGRGEPSSLSVLLDDAKYIAYMLEELFWTVRNNDSRFASKDMKSFKKRTKAGSTSICARTKPKTKKV